MELTEAVEDGPRPFKVFLDVGLKRTSTGSRVFGAMKGGQLRKTTQAFCNVYSTVSLAASDGGLLVPHSEKRFPGYDPEAKELDAEVLKKYIFGGHVCPNSCSPRNRSNTI